jgi:hypothetical protein
MPKSAFPGTTWENTRQRWKAQARLNGVVKSLGYYLTQEEAYAAVVQAKAEIGTPTQQLTLVRQAPPLKETALKPTGVTGVTTVAQSNVLIERPWSMTVLEARMFVLLLRGLKRDETDSRRIIVPLYDLVGDKELGGQGYQYLHGAIKGLDSIRIELPMPNRKKDLHLVPLVHSMKLDSGQSTFSGYFSPDVLPYLTNLVDSFTLGQVNDLLSIKTVMGYRFYWLLKSLEFRSPAIIDVNRLRELTIEQGSYPQYSDYRRYVLKPAVEELNSLNLDVKYIEHKQGRAVNAVEFHIKTRKHHKTQQLKLSLTESALDETPSKPFSDLTPLQEKVRTRLGKLKLTESQVRKVLQVLTAEAELTKLLKETYPILRDFETKAKPGENVAAATMALLKSTFPAVWAAN